MTETEGLELLKKSGPELISELGLKINSVVAGVEFNEKDSVYRTYLKQFEAVQKAAHEQGKKPSFWKEVKAHVHAAGKQVEFMVKDFVYWIMRGGPIGSVYRFITEHLPVVGKFFRKANESSELMFKPSEIEKRRVASLASLRVSGLTAEKRVLGTVDWIVGRK